MIAQDEIVLEWTPTKKIERDLQSLVKSWFIANPEDLDDEQNAVIRAIYQVIDRKLINPNRPTPDPYVEFSSIRNIIVDRYSISDDEFDVAWNALVILVLEVINKTFPKLYTKPDPANE